MHGKYTGFLQPGKADTPETIYIEGVAFNLVSENTPAPFYKADVSEDDFNRVVLTRTNQKPNEKRIPALNLDGVEWNHASLKGFWYARLSIDNAKRLLAENKASEHALPGSIVPNHWDKIRQVEAA